uniref:Coiled-coil domain containing 105 n=1 Tax=Pelusios castaneus TaxID=367368 RepID=A0A8C8SBC5_9SAUR
IPPSLPAPSSDPRGKVWRQKAKATAHAAQQLRGRCWREAVEQWRPPRPPGQPQETPTERRLRLQGWRFKLDVTAAGETLEKPPEGPGVTLWKSKMKPPPWVSQLPLPCFRDLCASQSNGLAGRYTDAVRLVVSRLRQALTELNEQAKRLNLARQWLNAALAKVRTALLTNQQSALVRRHRPPAEQVPDQADALLRWEQKELRRLKTELEGDMDMSEAHLKALGRCRQTLGALCQERGEVLELLGQPLRMVLLAAGRDSWLSLSRPSSPFVVRNPTPEPNPVGPYTPGTTQTACPTPLKDDTPKTGGEATGGVVRPHTQGPIARAWVVVWPVPIGTSLPPFTLGFLPGQDRLYMTLGGMRSTLNRCQRFHEEMGITQGMTMGPESSKYLEAREKLTRPIVRVYQRHVGTQLPEAEILTQGSGLLERSMQKAAANVKRMQATQQHLQTSIRDKQTGYDVDANVQRLRRRRMHPRSSPPCHSGISEPNTGQIPSGPVRTFPAPRCPNDGHCPATSASSSLP